MTTPDLVSRARDAFRDDLAATPALTLRGANAVDDYALPQPFDADEDAPTEAYLERYALWAMPYLDAGSWRHYLPRLVEYALGHPVDPAMVVEATVRSLRPPDRVPPRLATLSPEQEAVVVAFLEGLALSDGEGSVADDARAALEEWWLPGAFLRSDAMARRANRRPIDYREVGSGRYRLSLPTTLEGGGLHHVETEHRTVESWRGVLFEDAYAEAIVNVYEAAHRTWRAAEESATRWLAPRSRRWVDVPGASKALCLDGSTYRYSPAEPERTRVVLALAGVEIVVLTLRGTERADVVAELDRAIGSFRIASA